MSTTTEIAKHTDLRRLNESRERKRETDKTSAQNAGRKWAVETAEYDELERLMKLREHVRQFGVPVGLAHDIVSALCDDDCPLSIQDAHDWWKTVTGNVTVCPYFAAGFLDGAMAVFDMLQQ